MPLSDLAAHFRRTFPDVVGTRLLIALSGGADSVALLHLLREPCLRLRLEVAHVHHGVRGTEADADAESCRQLAAALDLPFHMLRLPPAAASGQGREAAWRHLRYLLLHRLAREGGIDHIATGHHRDDVAEGVLMQLLRGGGPRALAGIRERTGDGVIRPLLPYSRDEIRRFLTAAGISWREDSSNLDQTHLRNRVRHQVLPVMERASPRLRQHLVALAHALAEDDAFLDTEAARRCPLIDPWRPDGGVPVARLAELPPPLRSRWLHRQVAKAGLGRITRAQVAALHRLLDLGQPRSVTLARRWRLRQARGRLWLEPPTLPPAYRFTLAEGTLALPLPTWSARMRRAEAPANDAVWSWRAGPGTITVRSPSADDTVIVGHRRRRLRSLLGELLPRHLRDAWPVFCVNGTIFWVPGMWECFSSRQPGSRVVEVIRS